MKKYENPELKIICFEEEDVIRTSGENFLDYSDMKDNDGGDIWTDIFGL